MGGVCLCFHVFQEYATKTRLGIRRGKTSQELKEAALEPSLEKIFKSRWQPLVNSCFKKRSMNSILKVYANLYICAFCEKKGSHPQVSDDPDKVGTSH